MKIEDIARIAHEANRALCQTLGDDSQPPWDDTPDWQRDATFDGVRLIQSRPLLLPAEAHTNWVAFKQAAGWTYGEKKDPVAKTHPCLVPYAQLPREQRRKDILFVAIAQALTQIPGD